MSELKLRPPSEKCNEFSGQHTGFVLQRLKPVSFWTNYVAAEAATPKESRVLTGSARSRDSREQRSVHRRNTGGFRSSRAWRQARGKSALSMRSPGHVPDSG